jgi:hypothetical protein
MNFYIKTWPDDTATLMTDNGQVLWSFHSLDDAVAACHEWYAMNEDKIDDIDYIKEGEDYSVLDTYNYL